MFSLPTHSAPNPGTSAPILPYLTNPTELGILMGCGNISATRSQSTVPSRAVGDNSPSLLFTLVPSFSYKLCSKSWHMFFTFPVVRINTMCLIFVFSFRHYTRNLGKFLFMYNIYHILNMITKYILFINIIYI